jgi:uncharacterized alpha-E superfamily protein
MLTYRQRYRSYLELRTVLELVLLDPNNPRGLVHQLLRLQEALDGLPDGDEATRLGSELSERDRLALEALTQVRLVSLDRLVAIESGSVLREGLDQALARITHLLARMSDVITEQYFVHLRESRQLAQAQVSPR